MHTFRLFRILENCYAAVPPEKAAEVYPTLGKRTQHSHRQMPPGFMQLLANCTWIRSHPSSSRNSSMRWNCHPKVRKPLIFHFLRVHLFRQDEHGSRHPCKAVTLPPLETGKEKVCYTLEQSQQFLDTLADAPLKWQVFFSLALLGGSRREALCGFEFENFDMEAHTVSV